MVYRREPDAGNASASIRRYGSRDISFEANGSVNVDDRFFPEPGGRRRSRTVNPGEGEDRQRSYDGTLGAERFEDGRWSWEDVSRVGRLPKAW